MFCLGLSIVVHVVKNVCCGRALINRLVETVKNYGNGGISPPPAPLLKLSVFGMVVFLCIEMMGEVDECDKKSDSACLVFS